MLPGDARSMTFLHHMQGMGMPTNVMLYIAPTSGEDCIQKDPSCSDLLLPKWYAQVAPSLGRPQIDEKAIVQSSWIVFNTKLHYKI